MRAIREFAGLPLMWVQPKVMQQRFELRYGDEVLAAIQWKSSWRSRAVAETAEGSWSFDRRGFTQKIIIDTNRPDIPPPAFTRRFAKSAVLTFPDGHAYLWKHTNFWGTKRAWTTPDSIPLVSFKTKYGFMKTGSEVTVEPFAAALPDLPLLMTLGWYLMVIEARDSNTAASTAVIS